MNRLIKSMLVAMLLMGVVAVGLGLFAYFYMFVGEVEREESEEAERKVLVIEQDEIREIIVERDDGSTMRAVKREDDWMLQEPLEAAGDNGNWSSMARSLGDAKRTKRFPLEDLAGANLGGFGLATPELIVTVAGIDGATKQTLAIGGKNPARKKAEDREGPAYGPQVYARLDDEDAIVTIDESVKNAVDKKLFDLRDKRIVAFETADVRRLEVEAGDLSYRLDRLDADRWQIAQPFEAQADGSSLRTTINKIRNGRIKQFIDETPADYATYGLAEPVTRVVFWTGEEGSPASWSAHAVLLGSTSDVTPANCYAKRENQDNIFSVDVTTFSVPGELDELRLRQVTPMNSWDVNRMTLSVAGEKILEVTKDAGDWLQVHPKGGKCTWSSVNTVLRAAVDLKVDEFLGPATGEAGLGLDEEDIVIEIVGKDGDERIALGTIQGGTDGVRWGIRQPPREVYSVKASDVQALLDSAQAVELEEPEEEETGEV